MKTFDRLALGVFAAALALIGPAAAQERTTLKPGQVQSKDGKAPATADVKPVDAEAIRAQRPSYPLTKCVASGDELGKGAVDHVVKGRLVRLCCADCIASVEKDPSAAIKKVDEGVVAAQKRIYPLATCVVTGEKLSDTAIDHVNGTKLVRLANADAVAQFEKDPKTFMAKVDKGWIEAQRPGYPTKSCVVSGEPIEGNPDMTPFDYLHGTKLVRLCCRSCVRSFQKDPDTYLKKIAAAN